MAHNVETMAYAGETPWHGLGKPVPNDLTTEQMLVAASLDWEVKKYPLYAAIEGKRTALDFPRSVLVRETDKTQLTVVGEGWEPIQNAEAFGFFHDYVMAGDMEMHTAGSLQNGKIVWCLARTNEGFKLNRKDEIENYLLFTNYHMFGKAADVRMTPIRVVCNNTLTLALEEKGKSEHLVKIDHRKKFDVEEVKNTMALASTKLADYKDAAKFLASKTYTPETVSEYVNRIFPISETVAKKEKGSLPARKILEVLDTQPGANMAPESWWNAFNAVTFATDHLLGRDETRLSSAWYGPNRAKKTAALNLALEYANAA